MVADLPLETIWMQGRRVYLRCEFKSGAQYAMKGLGAHWDQERKAWWIGSGRKNEVVAIARRLIERRQEVDDVKGLGLLVRIPFAAVQVRELAKKLGGLWISESKLWAMPTQESLAQVVAGVDAAARAAASATLAAEVPERKAAVVSFGERAQKLAAGAGRVIVDESPVVLQWSAIHGRRAEVEGRFAAGTIVRKNDGSRLMIVEMRAQFHREDDEWVGGGIGDLMGTGWVVDVKAVRVELTSEEQAEVDAEAAVSAARDRVSQIVERFEIEAEIPQVSDGQLLHLGGERVLDAGTIYGGGSWFVITESHVWYVLNNGGDGDDWQRSNVATGGAGAIGRRLPLDEALATELRALDAQIGAGA